MVQQKQGRVRPTTRFAGTAVNDNNALESEADSMAERVVRATGSRGAATTGAAATQLKK